MLELQEQVTRLSMENLDKAKTAWAEKGQPAMNEYTKQAAEQLAAVQKTASEQLEAYKPQIEAATEKLKEAQKYSEEGVKLTKEKLAELQKAALQNYGWVAEQVKTKGPTFFLAKSDDDSMKPFEEAKKSGCEVMEIGARQDLTTTWIVQVGDTIEWKFAVQAHDIEFHVAMRKMGDGGSTEEVVVDPIKVTCDSFAEGTWTMEESGTVVIVWDNKYSWLTGKQVAYSASVLKDGESPVKAPSTSSGLSTMPSFPIPTEPSSSPIVGDDASEEVASDARATVSAIAPATADAEPDSDSIVTVTETSTLSSNETETDAIEKEPEEQEQAETQTEKESGEAPAEGKSEAEAKAE
jgi:phage repressor protein C with HTH and peptisase S24 domain